MKKLALILALTTAIPSHAGGPVLEDTTETVAPDRARNGWIVPVLLGVLAIGLIANGGGDGVSVDPAPGPKPCVKTEGGC